MLLLCWLLLCLWGNDEGCSRYGGGASGVQRNRELRGVRGFLRGAGGERDAGRAGGREKRVWWVSLKTASACVDVGGGADESSMRNFM